MKHINHISSSVQMQIIREYKQKNPDGSYRWILQEIADNHEVSLSTVNKLVKMAQCQNRPRGGRRDALPDARTMKILREASEPGARLEDVGIQNPRTVVVNGRSKSVPVSKQRISEIVNNWIPSEEVRRILKAAEQGKSYSTIGRTNGVWKTVRFFKPKPVSEESILEIVEQWKDRIGTGQRIKGPQPSSQVKRIFKAIKRGVSISEIARRIGRSNGEWVTHKVFKSRPLSEEKVAKIVARWKNRYVPGIQIKGFKRGDIIEWAGQTYTVTEYYDSSSGAVIDNSDGRPIDPFCWSFNGSRSKLVKAAK